MNALPARVLVTGGATGIGRAVASALVECGSQVIILGRRADLLGRTADQLGATAVPGDVLADPDALLDRVGPVDGLVHSAGAYVHAPLGAWTAADWQHMWAVHVEAPALLSQAFAARCQGPGSILAISSTLAERTAPGAAAYSAAKAGLCSLVRSLAVELAPRHIRANALLPGVVPTDMTAAPRGELSSQEQLQQLVGLHPLGRLGTPEEVAQAAVALLGNAWTTGAMLAVDGGLLIA